MGKNEMGSPMNAYVEFGTGNVPDTRLEVKKSLPEARRYTQSSKDRRTTEQLLKR